MERHLRLLFAITGVAITARHMKANRTIHGTLIEMLLMGK